MKTSVWAWESEKILQALYDDLTIKTFATAFQEILSSISPTGTPLQNFSLLGNLFSKTF